MGALWLGGTPSNLGICRLFVTQSLSACFDADSDLGTRFAAFCLAAFNLCSLWPCLYMPDNRTSCGKSQRATVASAQRANQGTKVPTVDEKTWPVKALGFMTACHVRLPLESWRGPSMRCAFGAKSSIRNILRVIVLEPAAVMPYSLSSLWSSSTTPFNISRCRM